MFSTVSGSIIFGVQSRKRSISIYSICIEIYTYIHISFYGSFNVISAHLSLSTTPSTPGGAMESWKGVLK